MSIREQIIAEIQAKHGRTPSNTVIRMIERDRVGELDPSSPDAQRIRAEIAERDAVTREALGRWFAMSHDGLPLPMPSVASFEAEIRRERAAA